MDKSKVEEIYKKKTLLEQILLRPDTYIGSIESYEAMHWVMNQESNKIEYRSIKYVPGLYKIFDEILVNALDNYQRDHSMSHIDVIIDTTKNKISIKNDGKGIPVVIHKEYNIYVAELIFGNLLTSSNYNDDTKKVTGGRNGYGAKLANIFSTKFKVKHSDENENKVCKLIFQRNMSEISGPLISDYKGKNFTKITFWPDLKRFGMISLEKDIIDLMTKRVYDIAGLSPSSVEVTLNKKLVPVKGFRDYINLYLDSTGREKINDMYFETERWQVGFAVSDGEFQQVSFVNGISTTKGGTHVYYIADQLVEALTVEIEKKNKSLKGIKPYHIRSSLWIFINALIENPAFDSQTKEHLTLKTSAFGSTCEIPEKIIKKIIKGEIYNQIVGMANARENAKLKKIDCKKKIKIRSVDKLDDANLAGGKHSQECLLILTEGDSAKAFALKGIEVVGRDKYGVFPLRGKVMNVRDASTQQIKENKEIENLLKIIGLRFDQNYDVTKEGLRYGGILIMTDQDLDGSHIKGLLINFIQYFWPSLILNNNFLFEFITPLIKATKGAESYSFFTEQEYLEWVKDKDPKKFKIKYYKGLGTSTDNEAHEYFKNIDSHQKKFIKIDAEDDNAIDLAFNKKRAQDRKLWLEKYIFEDYLQSSIKEIRYKDFIDKEFINFSMYDNVRSIASICDGFKPAQRKVLYGCFIKRMKNEIKVAQLCGYIAEKTLYHNGEQSLALTIIGMAQNFVGSNNINLLMPNGQFGTRNEGGKDSSSPRYIFTLLNNITRKIFREEDDDLLDYKEEEGYFIEPNLYLPIIPMILVNGCQGIGTGYSTYIPNYNPLDIINNLKLMIDGKEPIDLVPWFKNFSGKIEPEEKGFACFGKYVQNEDILEITELPIGIWTHDYKTFLNSVTKDGKEKENWMFEDFSENHVRNSIKFEIKLERETKESFNKNPNNIIKMMRLKSQISTNNMVAFTSEGKLKRYKNSKEILEEFYKIRLEYYFKRKQRLVTKLEIELQFISNKVRFIKMIISGELILNQRKKITIIQDMQNLGFTPHSKLKDPFLKNEKPEEEKEGSEDESNLQNKEVIKDEKLNMTEYDYLLKMSMISVTIELIEKFEKEQKTFEDKLNILRNTDPEALWVKDLDELESALKELAEIEKEEEEKALSNVAKKKKRKRRKRN